ncbi:non-reducing end alpha-L-arabinofuranosidase family hydrolase [Sphingomonas sp. MS122]|uniref:non-reducing end alpha-L-arabinofuranosidase family hydrolase n=1 Tax=Sphingomonas sp. MS122 TaxID=3412683 RepID=UPI003C30DBB5
MKLNNGRQLGMILVIIAALGAAGSAAVAVGASPSQLPGFRWASSAPLISPPANAGPDFYGVKDPSVVYHDGKYHVFMTTATGKGWGLAYTSFKEWKDAPRVPIVGLENSPMGPGYRAAPQVFYFAPQKLWYLIYQGGDPLYSTSRDISDPTSWTAPAPFFKTVPEVVKQANGQPAWLDFWNICDERNCYLFFTGDNGNFYRAETPLAQFPNGFHNTTRVMQGKRDDIFEASNTYRIAGTKSYLTLIEAISPKGRYFRAWKSDGLAGEWEPPTPDAMNIFADSDNVRFDGRAWSEGVSHGEMIRSTSDQTLTIDPCKPLRFLYQGLDMAKGKSYEYIQLPYRLGLITATGSNPVSRMCKK